jgi:uncharacterized protein with NAD-binding domain and iron-sulfur cluster
MHMGADRRIKVAVLGGGCGAMAAAFELTKTPQLRARYEVTVYQQGWRLGGKGASGRNDAHGQRIQEHGLHAFLGFYENAFTLMREAYREWRKAPENPFQCWTDAFKPEWQLSLMEKVPGAGGERWSPWNVTLLELPGEPGDGGDLKKLEEMLVDLLHEIDRYAETAHTRAGMPPSVTRPVRSDFFAAVITRAREELKEAATEIRGLFHPALDEAQVIVRSLANATVEWMETVPRVVLELVVEARDAFRALAAPPDDDEWRHLRLLIELGSAVARGIVSDVLPPGKGFEAINDYDFKEWLEWHGAPPDVAWSAPTIALYDLGFAYVGGEATKENARAAAGVALRVLLSLALGYKKAPLWKMQAGMGDTVFTPLYEVLAKQRGVRFEFFHRVSAIEPSPDGNLVSRIRLSRQVELRDGYEPLVTVKGLPCWPAEPRWEQIKGGGEMSKHPEEHDFESAWCLDEVGPPVELEYGTHFDLVILGISIGALPDVAPLLIEASPRWKAMIDWTKTVATQSLQLWLTPTLSDLGWAAGSTVLTSYAEPFDSWGEMSHLIVREGWEAPDVPRSIEYFCGVLADVVPRPLFTDPSFPASQAAGVKANAIHWLDENTRPLWPDACAPAPSNGLDYSKLFDPKNRLGKARLDEQFWRANIDPTERYVLSVPGSVSKRLPPGDSDFANLYLAGDWTKTTLNGGCAEAAIESGVLAARAITKGRSC